MKVIATLALLLLFSYHSHAAEIALVNPGFEMPMSGQEIPGWRQLQHAGIDAYEMTLDSKVFHGGKHSFRMHRLAEQIYGLLEQTVDVTDVAAKNIEFSAMLRTSDVGKQGALLSVNFHSGSGDIISQENSSIITGTRKSWQQIVLRSKVPAGTTSISLGLMLQDKGTIWVDDVRLRTVEK